MGHPTYKRNEVKEFFFNPDFWEWKQRNSLPPSEWNGWLSGWQKAWGTFDSEVSTIIFYIYLIKIH